MTNYLTADGELIERTPFFKTENNHDTMGETLKSGTVFTEPTMAQQHGKEEADINVIVDRFLRTGEMPQIKLPPTYEAFGEVFDFQSAMQTLKDATDSFMALPAKVRSTFGNNPANFVAYVDAALEAGDTEQLEKWGMAVTRQPPGPKPPEAPPAPAKEPKTSEKAPDGAKT